MKSKASLLIFGAIMIVGFFTGCDMFNGSVTSQERPLEGFNGITLSGAGDVNVHPGNNFKVIVTTNDNIQDKVVTSVNDNTLRITERSGLFNASELTIDVYMPELKRISLSGAGNIKIHTGYTSDFEFSLSGAGNIDARNFRVQNATIRHSGVGNARIWATNALNGSHSGVGNILYKGSPAINVKRSGVGNIKPL